MKADVTVETTEGDIQHVTISVPDFIRWEKTYKAKTSELAQSWRMEDWTFLAWAALKRTGETDAKFDEWVQTVVEVQLGDSTVRPT